MLPDSLFLLVTGTSVLVRGAAAPQPPTLCWHDIAALRSLGVQLADDHFVIASGDAPASLMSNAGLHHRTVVMRASGVWVAADII